MYIIDRNKDFYDHHSYTYGIDKSITFDRRGSIIIDDLAIVVISYKSRYQLNGRDPTHVLLEIGNVQYLIKLSDFVFEKNAWSDDAQVISCSMELVRTFSDFKHYYDSPISIRGVSIVYRWHWRNPRSYIYDRSFKEVIEEVYENVINLPILRETQATSLLNGQEVWIALQTYFSSLDSDKDISIAMTDVEKAETHGFDKKTSFRHPIK